MTGLLNSLRVVFPVIALLVLPFIATSQYLELNPQKVEARNLSVLSEHFRQVSVYDFDLEALSQTIQGRDFRNAVSLHLDGIGTFNFSLVVNPIYNEDMVIRLQTESGIVKGDSPDKIKTFKGYSPKGDKNVRLTIDRNFINGFIETDSDVLYLELLRNYSGSANDLVVAYYESDVLDKDAHLCDERHFQNVFDPETVLDEKRAPGDCYEVEIAFANDWLMYDDHGNNIPDVENHNLAVINNVQANYDNEFEEELEFNVVEIFVVTCSTCDPWTSSTDPGTLLDDFADWAPSGFDETHDMANLWTDRNFNGATVGLAWVAAVCLNNFKYSTTQDFTTTASLLRALLAHEMGHLFGAFHDAAGSNTIMAPSLNSSNNWSAASINSINDYIDGISCLGPCPAGVAPEAAFSSNTTEGCSPLTVHFIDESTGFIEDWFWEFEGGSPATSTQESPWVTYDEPGTYDVSLTVSNQAGSTTLTLQDYITVLSEPVANFDYVADELSYSFFEQATGADSYEWDFGDGQFSEDPNPTHQYVFDGIYEVILTVVNECGIDIYTETIEVISVPVAAFGYDPGEGCEPLTVQFFNESTPNATEFYWSFDGGIPSTSEEENPQVLYMEPGTYSVTFVASNSAGDDVVILDDIIIVNPLAEAGFNYSVTGLTAQFINTSVNAQSVLWLFGDGESSGQINPSHTYATGGLYTVLQIVDNDCGSDTMIQEISVNGPPQAGMSLSTQEGCAPLIVQFMSTSTGDINSYSWSFPGGEPSSSSLEDPVVTYNVPGTYSATLIVTNSIGSDTIILPDAVTVFDPVISDFNYIVDGALVDFTNQSSGETEVLWVIDGETYDDENPSVFFPEDGDYSVMLIATGVCGSDTSEQTFHIATPPMAGFSASGPTTGCQPFTVQFVNSSSSNVSSFAWSFPGGTPSTSDEPNPEVVYEEAGVYSVSLVVTSEVGTDELVFDDYIVVNPLPEAMFTTVQTGTQVSFQNTSEDAVSYLWLFGDGNSSSDASPMHDYGAFGTYEILLIATNGCGSDTMTVSLQLDVLPVPGFSAGIRSGCAPLTVEFKDASQNGAEMWSWEFPGGNPSTSTDPNPVIIYENPGVYDVTLTVFNSAGSQALVRQAFVVVELPPLAGFNANVDGDLVEFENTSEDATGYLWDFGDGETSEEIDPVHVYAGTGNYTVTLISYNSCGADTTELLVQVLSTAIFTPYDKARPSLWPNPNSGEFNLDAGAYDQDSRVDVFDAHGVRVWSSSRLEFEGEGPVRIRLNVAPGLYYVTGTSGGKLTVLPMVVSD